MAYEKIGLENLPNVYLNKIQLSVCWEVSPGIGAVTYGVSPRVSLYDYKKDYGSVWFHQKNLSRFLQVEVTFLCALGPAAKLSVESVIAGNNFLKDLINDENIIMNSATFAAKDFNKNSTNTEGLERFYKSYGFGMLSDIQLTSQQFGSKPPDLYVFAQAYIDVDQLKDAYSANFDYTPDQHYYGPLSAEKILNNGQEVTQAQIFYATDDPMSFSFQQGFEGFDLDRVTFGAVHFHEGTGFMEGSFHSSRDHDRLTSLTLNEVLKINYIDCGEDLLTSAPPSETTVADDETDYIPTEEEPELTDDGDTGTDDDNGNGGGSWTPGAGDKPGGGGGYTPDGETGPTPGTGGGGDDVDGLGDPGYDPL